MTGTFFCLIIFFACCHCARSTLKQKFSPRSHGEGYTRAVWSFRTRMGRNSWNLAYSEFEVLQEGSTSSTVPWERPHQRWFYSKSIVHFERLFECRFFNQIETIFCKALGGATGSSMSCTTRRNCFPLTKKLRLTRNSETFICWRHAPDILSYVVVSCTGGYTTGPKVLHASLIWPSSLSTDLFIEVLIDLLRNKARRGNRVARFACWVCLNFFKNPFKNPKRKWPICVRSRNLLVLALLGFPSYFESTNQIINSNNAVTLKRPYLFSNTLAPSARSSKWWMAPSCV